MQHHVYWNPFVRLLANKISDSFVGWCTFRNGVIKLSSQDVSRNLMKLKCDGGYHTKDKKQEQKAYQASLSAAVQVLWISRPRRFCLIWRGYTEYSTNNKLHHTKCWKESILMRKETRVPRANQKVKVRLTERKLKSYDLSSRRLHYASLTP